MTGDRCQAYYLVILNLWKLTGFSRIQGGDAGLQRVTDKTPSRLLRDSKAAYPPSIKHSLDT